MCTQQDSMNFKYLCQSEIKSIKTEPSYSWGVLGFLLLCSGLACMYTNYLNNQQSKVINIPTMFPWSASTYRVRCYFNFSTLKIFVYYTTKVVAGHTVLLLVFSATTFKIDQNINQNHSKDKVQNQGNERR